MKHNLHSRKTAELWAICGQSRKAKAERKSDPMTRTFPDRPSIEPAPSSTDPTIEQRWWVHEFDLGGAWCPPGKATIIDEHCFTVAGSMDENTARHIVQVHNKSIGV